jgi:ADP-heptose:LPS heptosyltransferase
MNASIRHGLAGLSKLLLWKMGQMVDAVPRKRHARPEHVLIARIDVIGDFVLFAPSLSYIRNKFPDARLSLLVDRATLDLAKDCPFVDDILCVDVRRYRRNGVYRAWFLSRVATWGVDLFLNPAYSRELVCDELALWSGARHRIAWDANLSNMIPKEKTSGDRIYDELVRDSGSSDPHESERNIAFIRHLGIEVPAYPLKLWQSPASRRFAESVWSRHQLEKYFVVSLLPGSMHSFKRWGEVKFRSLVERISSVRTDAHFLILGTKADRGFLSGNGGPEVKTRIHDLCGETKLDELGPIFERCSLVVGNDTGPIHIAAAAGVPTICIVGGGHFGRFLPYSGPMTTSGPAPEAVHFPMECFGCNWRCIYTVPDGDPYPCIVSISVDDVMKKVTPWLRSPQA